MGTGEVQRVSEQQPSMNPGGETARLLAGASAYIETLPAAERQMAEMAAAGSPLWEIAQQCRVSEGAVARVVDGVVAVVTGRPIHQVETGGLGSDTDPGVTGGYGDTGFGALDTEPIPDNTEPSEGA